MFQHISLLSQFFPHDFAFEVVSEEEYEYSEEYEEYQDYQDGSQKDNGRFLGFSQPTFSRYSRPDPLTDNRTHLYASLYEESRSPHSPAKGR